MAYTLPPSDWTEWTKKEFENNLILLEVGAELLGAMTGTKTPKITWKEFHRLQQEKKLKK